MKKYLFSWMTIALMAFVCVSFSACGGDDDDNAGGGHSSTADGQSTGAFQGAKRVFGDNLVKAMTSSSGTRWEFTYDAKGFMTKAKKTDNSKSKTYEYNISYSENMISYSRYSDGKFKETQTASIGSNGFISKTSGDDETYAFTYDNAGHLTRFTVYDDGEIDDDTYLTWQNGNVISAINNDNHSSTYTITYKTDSQEPIANTVSLADFDHMTSIDIDIEEFLIYSGAIGFGPAQLPLGITNIRQNEGKDNNEVETETIGNSWKLDNQNRPVSLERETTYKGSSYKEKKTYTWEY